MQIRNVIPLSLILLQIVVIDAKMIDLFKRHHLIQYKSVRTEKQVNKRLFSSIQFIEAYFYLKKSLLIRSFNRSMSILSAMVFNNCLKESKFTHI